MLLLALGLAAAARAEEPRPLKVLWATGGGFHDYPKLTPLLTQAIQKRANVRFEVISDYKTLAEKGFADRYDAVVYFFSYHDKSAKPVVDNIAATIHDGKPAMFIHGTLHSFRELGEDRRSFCEAIGLTSVEHDPLRPLATKKAADHPIIHDWPDDWKTPGDELYQNVKIWRGATPLLTAFSETSKKDHVVAWVNRYGRGKVFGTSLGHDMKTAGSEAYQQLLANGLLWICGKLDPSGKPLPGYAGSEAAK
jgi:type 1 glutamine amidotransferase